jgi:hypothetical protein
MFYNGTDVLKSFTERGLVMQKRLMAHYPADPSGNRLALWQSSDPM